jgi:hypothetical protein
MAYKYGSTLAGPRHRNVSIAVLSRGVNALPEDSRSNRRPRDGGGYGAAVLRPCMLALKAVSEGTVGVGEEGRGRLDHVGLDADGSACRQCSEVVREGRFRQMVA